MVNAKKKGNIWENKLSNWLCDNGIKAWKDGASGGGSREKGDVGNGLNVHIECKAVKKINLQKVWQKAVTECQKTHNDPAIFIHFDNMPDNEWLTVVHSETWLDLIKSSQTNHSNPTSTIDPQVYRNLKYRITNAVTALKQLLKELDN